LLGKGCTAPIYQVAEHPQVVLPMADYDTFHNPASKPGGWQQHPSLAVRHSVMYYSPATCHDIHRLLCVPWCGCMQKCNCSSDLVHATSCWSNDTRGRRVTATRSLWNSWDIWIWRNRLLLLGPAFLITNTVYLATRWLSSNAGN
jgi:hypothetical protein